MSGVLVEEEAEALHHVLAFLDEQEALLQLEQKDAMKESADRRSGESVQQRRREQRLATKTRYRGRVKEEFSRLRSDARALETALAHLKDNQSKRATKDAALTDWPTDQAGGAKETAAREYRRRKEAETTNQQLKLLLARVRKACSSSAGIWDKILSDKVRA